MAERVTPTQQKQAYGQVFHYPVVGHPRYNVMVMQIINREMVVAWLGECPPPVLNYINIDPHTMIVIEGNHRLLTGGTERLHIFARKTLNALLEVDNE